MQNKLTNLNDHLFEMIERLNDDDLTNEELEREIKRANAMTSISNQIINNAKVELDATKLVLDYSRNVQEPKLPPMISYDKN